MERLFFSFLFAIFLFTVTTLPVTSQIIGGGGFHSTIRCGNGYVSAFGWDATGQLGQGAFVGNLLTPNFVVDPSGVGYLDSITRTLGGELHSIALHQNGTVWTWGSNSNGQLGNNTIPIGTNTTVPTVVQGTGGIGQLTNVASISVGYYFSMALLSDGTVYAWGDNSNGQLGTGNVIDQNTPVQITAPGFDSIAQIACGEIHSLALDSAGNVWVWGSNWEGKLGLGAPFGDYLSPTIQPSLSNITDIAAGLNHSLFLRASGSVYACGSNFFGATGTTNIPLPGGWVVTPQLVLDVTGGPGILSNIVEIDAGAAYSMARTSSQNVVTWGANFAGQLGDNTTIDRGYPVSVLDATGGPGLLSNVIEIGLGNDHSMALINGGTVYAWGHNSAGPLGIGTQIHTNGIPTLINNLCEVFALPIELVEFNGYWNNGKVELNWKTSSEINNAYYTIERSVDVINWEKIMMVNGAGNSHQLIEYFEIDHTPYPTTSYYRLKQTDFDGAYTYSNIIAIKPEKNPIVFNLYPNPSNGKFNINLINNHESFTLILRDIEGREIYSKAVASYINGHDIMIDLENKISSGEYIIIGSSHNQYFQSKLIVK